MRQDHSTETVENLPARKEPANWEREEDCLTRAKIGTRRCPLLLGAPTARLAGALQLEGRCEPHPPVARADEGKPPDPWTKLAILP